MSEQVIETYEDWCRVHYGQIGEVNAAHKLLLLQGGYKFGPANDVQQKALLGVTDRERLMRLCKRLLEVSSWEELLATP